ncbi:MAG TPA: DegT/DnrJ/EryC1/StrS family aminotransferase [Chthoniobacteraceae bacterium]|jgi:CDP-6-deoxy-D-xylo-4-hexulose-3-dehydrase|nr:DegT/DnrJ/EryC1/StrS family aminotransferase [Chthoniobacteraceae bacterium]
MRTKPLLPCTGRISTKGFASFLEKELSDSRRNLHLLETDLIKLLAAPSVTLVNSGSSANLAAAIVVRQRCGARRRVLLAGFSFPTTIASFTLLGFDVCLVDTEPGGFNLDPQALRAELNDEVAAVVVTHFLGFPAQLGQIAALTRSHSAMLIQDACETMSLQAEGASVYDFGDLITHSFYHPHHLSSFGGGAVVASSPELHDLVQSVVHWGRACRCHFAPDRCEAPAGLNHNFWYEREGINVEMSELNACFARWQLQSWPQQEARRWAHWRLWERALTGLPGVEIWPAQTNVSPFVFPIGVAPERFAAVTRRILAGGVEIRSIMGGAMHRHPAYRHLAGASLKNCEATGARTFFVGLHQTLETAEVEHATTIVRQALEETS